MSPHGRRPRQPSPTSSATSPPHMHRASPPDRSTIERDDDPRADGIVGERGPAPGVRPVTANIERAPVAKAGRDPAGPAVAFHRVPTLDVEGVAALAGAMLDVTPPRVWAQSLHAIS